MIIIKWFIKFFISYRWRINQLEYICWGIILFLLVNVINILWVQLLIYYWINNYEIILYYSLWLIYSYSLSTLIIKRFHDMWKSGFLLLIPIYNIISPLLSESEINNKKYWIYKDINIKWINNKSISAIILILIITIFIYIFLTK